MKDYKSFIGEAAGKGFGKDAAYHQAVKREGRKVLKKEQETNRKEKEAKQQTKNQQTTKKEPIGYAFSPDGPGRKGASGRRYERERMRDTKIDAIKHQRGQRLKQRVGAARTALIGKGSGTIGTTGGGNSSDPSVRYQ